jgi:hypothetical protein
LRRFPFYAAAYEDELWALLIIQRAQVQLRLVLPLDDSGVQAFIRHGLRHRRICLALDVEDTDSTVHVLLEAGLGDVDAFENLLARARPREGALTQLVQLTEMMSAAMSVPSLEPACRAVDAVTVLVSNRAHELAEAPTPAATPLATNS